MFSFAAVKVDDSVHELSMKCMSLYPVDQPESSINKFCLNKVSKYRAIHLKRTACP